MIEEIRREKKNKTIAIHSHPEAGSTSRLRTIRRLEEKYQTAQRLIGVWFFFARVQTKTIPPVRRCDIERHARRLPGWDSPTP